MTCKWFHFSLPSLFVLVISVLYVVDRSGRGADWSDGRHGRWPKVHKSKMATCGFRRVFIHLFIHFFTESFITLTWTEGRQTNQFFASHCDSVWPLCSCSRGEVLFGPDNLGDAAINGFLQKHSCNLCCHRLGLKGQKCHKVLKSVSSCKRK